MNDFITCPLCGKSVKRLKKHLRMAKQHKELDVDKWICENPDIKTISDSEYQKYSDRKKKWCSTTEGRKKMSEMSKIAWNRKESRNKLLEGRKRQHESEEFKQQHREVGRKFMTEHMADPIFFEKAMKNIQSKGKRINFTMSNGEVIRLRSELEYGIALYLKEHNIEFRYEKDPIYYSDSSGKVHSYWIDFYIPSLDIAIEGKPKQLWNREDTQIKYNEAKKNFKTVLLVAYDLTELDSIIGSVTTTESISKEKDLRE